MIWQTPIGSRLELSLDAEYRRMENEWFFKWHQIGWDRVVEIDSFNGRMIRYGGIKFSGTARTVYWDTIQRYLRIKISDIFDELEVELQKYPIEIREQALKEATVLINGFAGKIRNTAVAKDRILRGDGIDFPPKQDLGRWDGSQPSAVQARAECLRRIYCTLASARETASTQTIINNISGANARINVNSTDNSVNSVVENSIELFDQLTAALTSQIQAKGERDKLLTLVAEMRATTHKETFNEKYQNFIAAAANHITIVEPFLPALAAFAKRCLSY